MSALASVVTVVLLAAAGGLTLIAAVGLHRLGDTRSRMHAATKPATLGVICATVGALWQVESTSSVTKLLVIVGLQVITAPVGAHVLSRAITMRERSDIERP